MESLPPGFRRNQALENIRGLDCANPDSPLASCDPSVPPPSGSCRPGESRWKKLASTKRPKALATTLKTLVCSAGDDAVFVLGGIASPFNNRLAAAGPEAPALIDFIMSEDCPVSVLLTDDDKAKLLRTKQEATKKPGG